MTGSPDVMKLQAIKNAQIANMETHQRKEGNPKKGWGDYGSDHKHYAKWFGLPENYFQSRVNAKKASGKCVYGLDLMSNTAFLDSLDISGIAVGLTKDENEVGTAAVNNRYLVAGDLLTDRKRIWPEIDDIMRQHNFNEGFDIITMRGMAGLPTLTENPIAHFLLLQEMWQRLAIGGVLVAETPYESEQVLKNTTLLNYWNTIPGIHAKHVKNGLVLEKSKRPPQKLPLNFTPFLSKIRSWNRSLYFE